MNYQVLARRYRPRRFDEVVGQESVAATLRAAIQQERIAHAYLFAGPRGIGKTSMARIFAKALNCPRAADRSRPREEWGDPCDACTTCEAVHLGQDIDVVEMDGASHRGIEEVRGILEGVNRPATKSPFKVYIIDEVHMLTREAFNALLKTLEEPPAHVKFVFATTEPHRIPETVLSRCQRFDFHPIGEDAIVRRLSQILDAERRTAEEGLLERIARYGKGGLRDAQTLLDQLMTFSEGTLRVEDLERITGRVPDEALYGTVDAMLAADPGAVLRHLRACFERGADPALLLEQIIDSVRTTVHKRIRDGASQGETPSLDKLLGYLQMLLDAASRLKASPFAEVYVETVLLKLARLEEPRALDEVLRALGEIEARQGPATPDSPRPPDSRRGMAPRHPVVPAGEPPAPAHSPPPAASSQEEVEASPAPDGPPSTPQHFPPDLRDLLAVWDQILVEVEEKHPSMAPYFRGLRPSPGEPGTFVLPFQNEFYLRQAKSPRCQEALLSVVRDVARYPWRVKVVPATEAPAVAEAGKSEPWGRTSDRPDEGRASPEEDEHRPGPAPPPSRQSVAGRAASSGDIAEKPIVKKSIDLFNGRII